MTQILPSCDTNPRVDQQSTTRSLRRIRSAAVLSGVCAGIGKYTSVDATLIRVGFVVLACVSFAPVAIYLTMSFVVPVEEEATAQRPNDISSMFEEVLQSTSEVFRAMLSFDTQRLTRCWEEQLAKFRRR
jgi:phage shock protein PspC (stress-responsive transcriptional regulator)